MPRKAKIHSPIQGLYFRHPWPWRSGLLMLWTFPGKIDRGCLRLTDYKMDQVEIAQTGSPSLFLQPPWLSRRSAVNVAAKRNDLARCIPSSSFSLFLPSVLQSLSPSHSLRPSYAPFPSSSSATKELRTTDKERSCRERERERERRRERPFLN